MNILQKLSILRRCLRTGGIVHVHNTYVAESEKLKGKVVLVTGATSGFGLAIAKQLISDGAFVVITGRSENKIKEALSELNTERAKGIIWDLTYFSNAKSKMGEAINLFGKLDIAINNAGVWTGKSSNDIAEDDWNKILDTNLKGLFFAAQAEAEYFKRSKDVNKIINITSMEGVLAGFGPYYASKWGANGITKGMAKELTRYNIIVNAIAPGPAKTNINTEYFKGQEDSQYNPDTRSLTGRMVLVEEVAGLASYLCSDISNSMVGQVLVIDGGISIH